MSHGDYLRRPGTWPAGTVPETSDFEKLDIAQTRALNGDDGGTWNPTAPIALGGSGGALTSAGSLISGGITTKRGGRLVLGANDFPSLSPSRSRAVTWNLWEMQQAGFPPTWLDNAISFYRDDRAFGINPGNGTNEFVIPARFIHAGATLSSVALRFRIPQQPTVAQMSLAHLSVLIFAATTGGAFINFPNATTIILPGIFAVPWATGTTHALGSYIRPSSTKDNGLYYKATSVSGTGTTGASEPTWPTTIGAAVFDNAGANQIIWTCFGSSGYGTAKQLSDPATLYASGSLQSLLIQLDAAVSNTVDPTANYYGIQFQIGPFVKLHSLQLTYTGITSLSFA